MGRTAIDVEQSGSWMPSEQLREAALAALGKGQDVTLNLDKIDHLEADALQILLALDREQKKQGRKLVLTHASVQLREWFAFAGAAEEFFPGQANGS